MIMALSIEGGIVQGASLIEDGDYKVRSVVVVDYDTDGMDEKDLTVVPQGGGETQEAYVYEKELENWTGEKYVGVERSDTVGLWLQKNYAPRIRHVIGGNV
jgi:hypothetical protein